MNQNRHHRNWQVAADELEFLLTDISKRARLSKSELSRFHNHSLSAAISQLRDAGYQSTEWRDRISLALDAAERARSESELANAIDIAAFTFFRLHILRPGPEQGQAMAWAELSLQLGETNPKTRRTKWFPQVRAFHGGRMRRGLAPSWTDVAQVNSEVIRECLSKIRLTFGQPPFYRDEKLRTGSPDPQATSRQSQQTPDTASLPAKPSQPSASKISSVEITQFRGIPGPLSISFASTQNRPVSAIIGGDNGVGKSSIVSAIEFACQARIGRRDDYNSSAAPIALNASQAESIQSASVTAHLADGSAITRGLERSEGMLHQRGDALRSEFGISPMSLQRTDIVRFLSTPPQERGLMFIDHFQNIASPGPTPTPTSDSLRRELADLKAQRRGISDEIKKDTGVPFSRGFEHQVQQAYLNGLTKSQYEDRFAKQAPPEAVRAFKNLERLGQDIAAVKRRVAELDPAKSPGLYEGRVRVLSSLLGSIDEPLTKAFQAVTRSQWVSQIRVKFGETAALAIDLEVELQNGTTTRPEQIFSEGYQDLVAFLFFLEVARAASGRGQARVLILDDVFQSVDASVRLSTLSYALEALNGWQIFLTVHDALWKAQVIEVMRAQNFPFVEIALRQWSFTSGPAVSDGSATSLETLQRAMSDGTVATVCAEAGRLLEQISDKLSYTLPISVTRRPGDRYTLGDLWPGVAKKLGKTNAKEIVDEISRLYHLRNMVGAHYNEWAEALPASDAAAFGRATMDLLVATYCTDCRKWVRESPQAGTWICRCGGTAIRPL